MALSSNTTLRGWAERREDYALQVVPQCYRRWGWPSLLGVLLSVPTALVYLSLGGGLVLEFGTRPLVVAMIVATAVFGTAGFIICRATANAGVDTDLLSIRGGFGYRGSGFTSLIYAVNFPIFFALEGSIIADAIHAQLPHIPLAVIYPCLGVIFIGLTWYGLTAINYIMWATLPIYLTLLIATVLKVPAHSQSHTSFWSYHPAHGVDTRAGPAVVQILAAVSAFIINASNSGDIGRMIRPTERRVATFVIGYAYEAVTFLGATLLGAWLAIKLQETNPGIYIPELLGIWGTIFVVISQLRINMLNAYSGSLAFANFSYRIFGVRPGRQWMLVAVVGIATIMMWAGILAHMTDVLTFLGIFTIAWLGALTSYVWVHRLDRQSSHEVALLENTNSPAFNPVGLIALATALAAALLPAFGAFGSAGKSWAPFISGGLAFLLVPLVETLRHRRANPVRRDRDSLT